MARPTCNLILTLGQCLEGVIYSTLSFATIVLAAGPSIMPGTEHVLNKL